MKCFEKDCAFEGNQMEAKNHTVLTGHETGDAYVRFKPDHPVETKPVAPATEPIKTEGAKA